MVPQRIFIVNARRSASSEVPICQEPSIGLTECSLNHVDTHLFSMTNFVHGTVLDSLYGMVLDSMNGVVLNIICVVWF